MGSRWSDLQRPPLSWKALASALTGADSLWREIRVVAETGSTNDDLLAAARGGAPEGLVLVAEAQRAGRGRLDRAWTSPPRAGLTLSVLLRPTVPTQSWGWLALLVGLSVQRTLADLCDVPAELKWPNDVQVEGRKIAGVLLGVAAGGAVAGIGLNVSTTKEELPRADATSLVLEEAACQDRDPVLRAVLRRIATDYRGWQTAGGDPTASGLHAAYVAACATLGREVLVSLPDGTELRGLAGTIDRDGRLVVATEAGSRPVASGDVVHVR